MGSKRPCGGVYKLGLLCVDWLSAKELYTAILDGLDVFFSCTKLICLMSWEVTTFSEIREIHFPKFGKKFPIL
jgi:hypothetical protein